MTGPDQPAAAPLPEQTERYPLDRVVAAITAGDRAIDLEGVDADLLAYLACALHGRLDRPLVIVTPEASDARRVAADLRFFTGDPAAVTHLPEIDQSPYGHLSPDRGAVMRLLAELARLTWADTSPLIVLCAATLARRVMPKDALVEHSFLVAKDQDLDRAACLRALADGGYHAVSTVEDPGTFAIRGGILDVYPPHRDRPIRIELWGDTVESLREFDPDTQRTRQDAGDTLLIPPVREELLIDPFKQRARSGILDAAAEAGVPTRKLQPILDDLNNGIPFMGVEGYRPAFYPALATLFDYLPAAAHYIVLDPLAVGDRLREQFDHLARGHEEARARHEPVLAPERHALTPHEAMAALQARPQLRAHVLQMVDELGAVEGPRDAITFRVPDNHLLSTQLVQHRAAKQPLAPLAEAVRAQVAEGARVVLACRQETQLDRLERVLVNYGVAVQRATEAPHHYLRPPRPGEAGAVLVQGDVGGGFRLVSHGFALITEEEIFGTKAPRRRARTAEDQASPFIQSFKELEPGDYVVHADHGIGRYIGLKKLVVAGGESDFLVVEFAGQDKLYLPVYKLGRLQKYAGAGQADPRVDKLGGTTWQKTRSKARIQAEEDALALLDLYARREMAQGYAFSTPDDYFRTFEGTFPFEETPDQERAIEEVLADMGRPRPMDRLLCGDVGFGKTEVALRAAMKAVVDAKQVAVLVPTTVLALQHYKTFKTRFADYPVKVALFSRLTDPAEAKAQLQDLKNGRIDIAVGTHRLLSQDVKFADLGLLVLDEEHRFGVRHKERLKELRTDVDVLAMTATPIPRTLQLSLSGIRDLSVITTPPSDRLSVRTYVCRATDEVVRDAILRELGRGGQVFFVHNRVQSIDARKAWLTSLVPEARIVVGHGQMDPKQLERVMVDFTEGRFNVLLSTTIIESGIDIPTANTMLVDHADRYGLAQLYQLRGRVGRSRDRGYCYLLVASEATLSSEARTRLAVIQKFTELGSGFHVASHDMELRGAGELLGTKQKGQVQAVGIDLYAELLQDAVRELRGQPPKVEFDPDINVQVNARLPEDYVPDEHLRLVLYKRLANATDEEQVLATADEMQDRFGELPGPAQNLIEVMRIRTLARQIGLRQLDHAPDRVQLVFHPESPMPVDRVVALVTAPGARFFAPADYKLVYTFDARERQHTVAAVRNCLQRLAEFVEPAAEEAS
ncbi:MAG: transcription-repair coupling factor [Myxococcales bacterium]|nr:transcription-repair coupling factor [Myxococcales bacterium]